MKKTDFLRGAAFLAFAQVIIIGTGYLIHLWVARVLDPYFYGLYGIILGVRGIANIWLIQGIPNALSKYTAERAEEFGSLFKRAFKIQVGLSLLITAVYSALSLPLSSLFSDPQLAPLLVFSALSLPCYAFYALATGALNGLRFFKQQALLSTFYSLIKFGVAAALTIPFGLFGAISGFIIAPLLGAIPGFAYLSKPAKERAVRTSLTKTSLLRFALSFSLLSLFLHIFMNTDLFLVKALVKDGESAGFYTAATTVARIPYSIIAALGLTLLPTASSLTKEKTNHEIKTLIATSARATLFILVGGLALAVPESQKIITFLYPASYQAAALPFSILLFALSILAIFFLAANVIAAYGKPHFPMLVSLLGVLASFALGNFLIPKLGLTGAAISTLCAASLATLIVAAHLFSKIPPPNPRMALRFLIAGAAILCLNAILKVNLILLVPKMLVLGLLYLGILLILGEVKMGEVRQIWRVLLERIGYSRRND